MVSFDSYSQPYLLGQILVVVVDVFFWFSRLLQGKVKQIVGSTLQDLKGDASNPVTNFESDKSAAEYARLYKLDGLTGGHVIMLGADPLSKAAALEALHAYPGIMVSCHFLDLPLL